MEFLTLVLQNILSPAILFFVLGAIAGVLKSDLEVPDSISRYLSIYLMMSIGFKGGVAIAQTPQVEVGMLLTILGGVGLSFLLPFVAYGLLRITTSIDKPTAAAVAAHYGSISMVTFATATAFLTEKSIPYEGYIVAILALMEAPAILSGLYMAHHFAPEVPHHDAEEKKLSREIFTNGAILLLLGAFLIGWLTGQPGLEKVEAFLISPFQGLLCLFLMDMGLLVTQKLYSLRRFSWSLGLFGVYMPLVGASLGLAFAWLIGMDVGTGTLFTVLSASASYIAVPAAMRLALPEAQPSVYVPLSLGITFPLNVTIGIPLYYSVAQKILT